MTCHGIDSWGQMVDNSVTDFLENARLSFSFSLNPQIHDQRFNGDPLYKDCEKDDDDDSQNEKASKWKLWTQSNGQWETNRTA